MRYQWDVGAIEDLEEATRFYFQEDPVLELRFSDCVDRALEKMMSRPTSWPSIDGGVRRVVVEVFPYSILYSIAADQVLVLAVAHHSRDPEYWKDRFN